MLPLDPLKTTGLLVRDHRVRVKVKMMDTITTSLSLSSAGQASQDRSVSSLKLKDLLSPDLPVKVLHHQAPLVLKDQVVLQSLLAKDPSSVVAPLVPLLDLLPLLRVLDSPFHPLTKDTPEAPLDHSLATAQLAQHLVLLVRVPHSGPVVQPDNTHQANLILPVPVAL